MLIDRLTRNLETSRSFERILDLLGEGKDATLATPGIVRPLVLSAIQQLEPRPMLVVISGEEAAERMARQLAAFLGRDRALYFPDRKELPWSDKNPDLAAISRRMHALWALASNEPVIVVASARSLLRTLAPQGSDAYVPLRFTVGEEIVFDELAPKLSQMGYTRSELATEPGLFALRGDILDVYPPDAYNPLRVEFFGDEVETISSFIASTGQSIARHESVTVYPCREMYVSSRGMDLLQKHFGAKALMDADIARDLEFFREGIAFAGMEKYLPFVYKKTATLIDHISSNALIVAVEPRSLFDDTRRRYEDLEQAAKAAKVKLDGLYVSPGKLDFGAGQRLTLASIIRAGQAADAELKARRPEVAGGDEAFIAGTRSLAEADYALVVAAPERRMREKLALALTDGGVTIASATDHEEREASGLLPARVAQLSDIDIANGFIIPEAKIAAICAADLENSPTSKRRRRSVDPTKVTFSFAPGDYVVHSTHGIALFREIVRKEVMEVERDYLVLEYNAGDKLFVPVEQIDRVTKYVGADGASPRLTRLNTSDWSRATSKARKAAKQLAFDLVDLYARRSTVTGFTYSPDTAAQAAMEAAFPYEETSDQLAAIADVKADMESDRPMDRLICGDVGFGKTEVALRAAFKATQDKKQVMILCPTTILAQQHYTTFSERFSPFGINVEVLSRFRTNKQQRSALEGFVNGTVDVLVGTHRLLSRDVIPHDLGLVIVDEEQRFGVGHKEQIKNLREQIDVLTLSATPIPRTLQMSLSGVRDMSVIDTPPPARNPIEVHVGEWDPDVVSGAIRRELARGGQVYYVSNRVKSIDDAVARVMEAAPEARVGVGHGQMSEHELERVMESFAANEIDVLVATTIVESGLDNPHSNTLIIEDSQRLGLAQLYQLKGRVGRSHDQAYAYFLFPRNSALTEQATERLTAISEHQGLGSGIKIAMRDLEIRGAGSLLGAEQHGNMSAVGFDLFAQMLAEAVSEARGEAPIAFADVRVDLPVHAYLPEEYVPDADERVRLYRRIAGAVAPEEIAAVGEEMRAKHGIAPEAVDNLLQIAKIKARASELGITLVTVIRNRLTLSPAHFDSEARKTLTSAGALFTGSGDKAKLTMPLPPDTSAVELAWTILAAR